MNRTVVNMNRAVLVTNKANWCSFNTRVFAMTCVFQKMITRHLYLRGSCVNVTFHMLTVEQVAESFFRCKAAAMATRTSERKRGQKTAIVKFPLKIALF